MYNYRIGHTADIQVKIRDKDLSKSYEDILAEIRENLIKEKVQIYVIAGDLTEYAASNDAEKKVIYRHLAEVIALPTILEVVLMNGNHDLFQNKKDIEANRGHNALDTFNEFIKHLEPNLAKKVTYLKKQKQYKSKCPGISWISYSLEDGMSNGSNLDREAIKQDTFTIDVYHDILKEYVDETGLKIKGETYDRIASIKDFTSTLVIAGDIHENWTKTLEVVPGEIRTFVYPGSPIQRNFGEGGYLKIGKKPVVAKAAPKVMKVYDLQVNEDGNGIYSISDIYLKNWIAHHTIDLTTAIVNPNFAELIREYLTQNIWGVNNNFIKFKLSTVYAKHEMELIKLAQDTALEKGIVPSIHVAYDKFILSDSVVVIDGVEDENESNEIDVDGLILDDVKLQSLFKTVLELQKPAIQREFSDEAEANEIMETIQKLFASQLDIALKSVPNYAIELNGIVCNGFMKLGENVIKLDVPGLTRITGTNGIGKTTLYNMLRWVIEDEVLENLPKASKVKNALLVFNDNLIDLDTIMVKLVCHINGTKVSIQRWVKRTWKQNTTDEQKRSLKWKDYVSGVERNLKLIVEKEGSEKTEKIGDEAQKIISRWFGKVANTIMILNQHKILTILNMNSSDLKQMVLDYIGVDYLNVLDQNLAQVKEFYEIVKPKVSKEQLKINLLQLREKLNKFAEEQTEIAERNELENAKQTNFEARQKELMEDQISLGNIPELIKTKKSAVSELQTQEADFQPKEKTKLTPFDEVEPTDPNNQEATKIKVEEIAARNR